MHADTLLHLHRQGDGRDELEQSRVGMRCVATGAMLALMRRFVFVYCSVLCPAELPPSIHCALLCLHSTNNEEALDPLKPLSKVFLGHRNRERFHLNVR